MLLDDSNDNYSFEIALVHQSRTSSLWCFFVSFLGRYIWLYGK